MAGPHEQSSQDTKNWLSAVVTLDEKPEGYNRIMSEQTLSVKPSSFFCLFEHME